MDRPDADLGAVGMLKSDVPGARAVVTDEHGSQPHFDALVSQADNPVCHLGAHAGGQRLSVEHDGGHERTQISAAAPVREGASVAEMTLSSEEHRDASLVGYLDDFCVSHRTSRLDDGGHPRVD